MANQNEISMSTLSLVSFLSYEDYNGLNPVSYDETSIEFIQKIKEGLLITSPIEMKFRKDTYKALLPKEITGDGPETTIELDYPHQKMRVINGKVVINSNDLAENLAYLQSQLEILFPDNGGDDQGGAE